MINKITGTALGGIQSGRQQMNRAANEIASAGQLNSTEDSGTDRGQDLTRSLLDLKAAELQTKASIKVLKVSDETLGTLLDVIS